jgi:hypothetical protein
MSDIYEPFDRLIKITVLGKVLEVPENNTLLRQLQFVAAQIGSGRYCWNGECRYCEFEYQRPGDGLEFSALACRVKGWAGMRVTKVAPEIRYNLALVLAAAPDAQDPGLDT